ncbi:MFS transporter [Bradyrhizobium ganzhouense]|uniref:MFS transporter n=1 Tax=Bradyrhizobium ganzhouense TaxID=1179767 RepID=UPI003CEA39B7
MGDSTKVRKQEIAEGWLVLVTSLFGIAVGAASLLFYSIGVFFEPFQHEFGWNRGQISGALIYLTLGFVISGPIAGWLIDRHGARIVALVSIPMLALIMAGLHQLGNSLTAFYALFFAAGSAGGGTTPIVYTRVVNGSFSSSRGLALGIVLAGTGIAALVLPPALAATIGASGWRTGFMLLAIAAALAWPLVLVGFRGVEGAGVPRKDNADGVDRTEALKSRVFWTIAIGFIAVAAAISGLVVHMVPLLRDTGMSLPEAAAIASFIGIGVIVGRVLVGWTLDRLFAPHVAAVVFLLTASGCVLLNLGGASTAPFAAFLLGFALGAEIDLIAYLTARYFGMKNYGFLYGSIYSMFSIGAAAGPAIVGHLFDSYGSYRIALWVMASCLVFGAAAVASLPQFARGR